MLHCCYRDFQGRKSVSVFPREWLIFPGFVFSPIYFNRVTLQLPSPSLPLCHCILSSHLLFKIFFPHPLSASICFLLCSFPLYLYASMCGRNPALGLHCFFHVRTSGDIKGLQRGLSVCISPVLTVCALDPSMRSALHSLTASLKPRLEENNMPAPAGCNCAHVYALADLLSPHTQALWGRSMFKGLSMVEAWLMTVESARRLLSFSYISLPHLPLWHSDLVVKTLPTYLLFKMV